MGIITVTTMGSTPVQTYRALTENLVLLENRRERQLAHVPTGVTLPVSRWRSWLLRALATNDNLARGIEHKLAASAAQTDRQSSFAQPRILTQSTDALGLTAEITGDCNLHCTFCPDDAWINFRRFGCRRYPSSASNHCKLTPKQWKTVLFDGFTAGCSVLEGRGGEVLLYPELVIELLEFAKELGFRRSILWTNGVLLKPTFVEQVMALNLTVEFLVQLVATRAELHDLITGTTGTFGNLLENISYLAAAEQSFSIVVPVTVVNQAQKDEIFESVRMLGVDEIIFQPVSYHPGDNTAGSTQITVNWRGDVLFNACNRLAHSGNVTERNLTDIIREAQKAP